MVLQKVMLLCRRVISCLSPVLVEAGQCLWAWSFTGSLGLRLLSASGAWKTKLYSSRPFRSLVAAAAQICTLLLTPHTLILLLGTDFALCLPVLVGWRKHTPSSELLQHKPNSAEMNPHQYLQLFAVPDLSPVSLSPDHKALFKERSMLDIHFTRHFHFLGIC